MSPVDSEWSELGPFTSGNAVTLLHTGDEFAQSAERLIRAANDEIHLQMYIFRSDEMGRRIGNELKQAAQRGVRVFLLLDSFGSADASDKFLEELTNAGVLLQWFRPLLPWKPDWGWGRRMHRKILVADGACAIVGGINIGNEYTSRGGSAWLDFAVEVRGPVCARLEQACRLMNLKRTTKLLHSVFPKRYMRDAAVRRPLESVGKSRVQVAVNEGFRGTYQVYRSYISAIMSARESIVIVCGYFLPNIPLLRALRGAQERGVRVQIVLGRVSDVWVMKWAMAYLYSFLLKAGIELYQWSLTNVHAKVAVVDGAWATVGSYNLDELSMYHNLELNVNIVDKEFSAAFHRRLTKILSYECTRVRLEHWTHRSWWRRALAQICYAGIRISILIPLYFHNGLSKRLGASSP